MSTRITLFQSSIKEYSLYQETLHAPIHREGFRVFYPVHLEVCLRDMDLNIELPDDLSIKLTKAVLGGL
jgi:hypothetical protein